MRISASLSPTSRCTSIAACSLVVLSLSAAPAFATRYATPGGSDTASCADVTHACSLTTAVDGHSSNQPSANEEVVVEPGMYSLPGPLTPAASGENIHGTDPLGTRISSVGPAFVVLNATRATNLSTLSITGSIVDPGGTLDRLYLYTPPTTANQVSCQCSGGVLRDSVILGGGGSGGGVVGYVGAGTGTTASVGPVTEDYRNDTILSPSATVPPMLVAHTGTDTSVKFAFTAENMILSTVVINAQGFPGPGPLATTVSQAKAGQKTTLTITHSDVAGASPSTGGAATNTDPSDIAGSPFPSFVQYPINLREVAGAPTVDAGLNDPLNGPVDLDGSLRTSGAATDMGAFEQQVLTVGVAPTPVVTAPQPLPFPIAEPKLKLLGSDIHIDFITTDGVDAARCTGVTLTCTVHGTLKATLRHHHKSSAIGTISGALHPGHKGNLTLNLTQAALNTLSFGHLDAKASVTTTSGLGRTKQTFTILLRTSAPDYTRKPKHGHTR